MKKCLVFTLMLTMIFPAYCFAAPQRIIPSENEILEGIMLIIEDGVVEEEEVVSFLEKGTFHLHIELLYFCQEIYDARSTNEFKKEKTF